MGQVMCNIIDEIHLNKISPKSTLVELKLDYEKDPIKFAAVLIEDEVFRFCEDYVKVPGWIQIDTKDSRQKTFVGKQLSFLKHNDERIDNAIPMYSRIWY